MDKLKNNFIVRYSGTTSIVALCILLSTVDVRYETQNYGDAKRNFEHLSNTFYIFDVDLCTVTSGCEIWRLKKFRKKV